MRIFGEERIGEEMCYDVIDANNATCGIIGSMAAINVDVRMYLRTTYFYRNVLSALLGFHCSRS